MKTRVIGCPKTIDGDLKCKEVPTSFGFDTACKVSFSSHQFLSKIRLFSKNVCFPHSYWYIANRRLLISILKEAYYNILLLMQIYSEMIGNVMIDARSTGKYYHCK